jgi:hypothetical protein
MVTGPDRDVIPESTLVKNHWYPGQNWMNLKLNQMI